MNYAIIMSKQSIRKILVDDKKNIEPIQPPDTTKPWRHKKKHSSGKKWLIIGVVLVVVIAGGVGGWFYLYKNNQKQSVAKVTRTSDQIDQVISDANALAANGDTSGAKKAYDSAIQQTSDSVQKQALLAGDASIYYNDENYDQALVVAKQAESIKLDSNLAALIAEIYRIKGDSKNAIMYYQKAITLGNQTNPDDNHSLFYQDEINGLEGK
jgi:tetratricopeptide (TPR) repeat protein